MKGFGDAFLGKIKMRKSLTLYYKKKKAAHSVVEGIGSGASSPGSKSQLCLFELCDLQQQNGDSDTTHTYCISNKCRGES